MPKLIKLYITQVFIGFGLSAAFVALLLWLNVANLWHLVSHTEGGVLAVVILWVFNGIVFAGVQFSIAIMRLARDDDDHGGGGRRNAIPVALAEPVPVRVAAQKARRTP